MRTYEIKLDGFYLEERKKLIPYDKSGIYIVYRCLYNDTYDEVDINEIIYIGKAEHIRSRIMNHEKNELFLKSRRDQEIICYAFAELSVESLDIVENALVFMQKPPLNDELKEHYKHEAAAFRLYGDTSGFKFSDFMIVDGVVIPNQNDELAEMITKEIINELHQL